MRLFGTDGIRGQAGRFPLNSKSIAAIGQAIGETLSGNILIGQDTRISSPWILDRLTAGLVLSRSARFEAAGVLPTPAIALLTKSESFSGGIMISASHNPFEDNGIKVFSKDGTKLKDTVEQEIERRIFELLPDDAQRLEESIPDTHKVTASSGQWLQRYEELLLSRFPDGQWLRGIRIVIDCAHGAMSAVAPRILEHLGANVDVICASPNGKNINASCGAVHMEALASAMKNVSADFGVAFDGDGDRSLFVSGKGKLVDGDAVLLVMSRRMKPTAVVGTSMTNYALEKALRTERIPLVRVGVGDRYVFEEMQKSGATLGGEPSGHIIFSDFRLSGDGLLTTLKLAETMVQARCSLDDLIEDWVPAPQLLRGVRVSSRIPIEEMTSLQTVMHAIQTLLTDSGRLVVRYSGTEPLLRVMIESDDAKQNEKWMRDMLAAIESDFKNPR